MNKTNTLVYFENNNGHMLTYDLDTLQCRLIKNPGDMPYDKNRFEMIKKYEKTATGLMEFGD
jgi:hypothetical protein